MAENGLARVAALRKEYADRGLTEDDLAASPFDQFAHWFEEYAEAGVAEPNAMVVSTASADGVPSSRMCLLKGFSEDGFTFFTNTESHKGRDLAGNPRISLLFPWHPVERQVRIDGTAVLVPRSEVEAYFASRPRGSQIGAWASPQSTPVSSRAELSARYDEALAAHPGEVPPPSYWGGYRVRPESLEFWQGRPGRMHDRLVYRRTGDGWAVTRLAP